ncbi:zinc metallopeptidase RseP [Novipirellula galeiformis]|uniref:Zinc metallopeptidase RseP n=1 Tax=Novipirellula galeiformis TaxID=2528004 RepID=A0A5C6CIV9_9BACT|nr:PDZ domain-containing protein [Novipirellula galeiformis]TWU23126.1 zinc metallopeptidase RseP [Novipirellula galeiformis]
MEFNHQPKPLLFIALVVGLSTLGTSHSADAQLFPRLRARLNEPLFRPPPSNVPQPRVRPSQQAQPRASLPLRPIQPVSRGGASPPGTADSSRGDSATAAGSGSLGVDVEPYRSPAQQGAVQGLIVTRISASSLAEEAGLRPGDLIVAINGQSTPTIESVIAVLRDRNAGERVVARVVRGRRIGDLTIPLIAKQVVAAKPTSPSALAQAGVAQAAASGEPGGSFVKPTLPPGNTLPAPPDASGASISPESIQARLGIRVEDAKVVRGAVVTEIEPDSSGARLGVQVADRIVSVDGQFVFTADAFAERLQQWSGERPLKLQLIRDERLLTLSLDSFASTANEPVAKSGVDEGKAAPHGEKEASLLEGMGAVLGGVFAGKGTSAQDELGARLPQRPSVPSLPRELPPAMPAPDAKGGTAAAIDPLAFGDDGSIERAKFEDEVLPMRITPTERSLEATPAARHLNESKGPSHSTGPSESKGPSESIKEVDPPSIEALELPGAEDQEGSSPTAATKTKRVKDLEAEIERLESELKAMKTKQEKKK